MGPLLLLLVESDVMCKMVYSVLGTPVLMDLLQQARWWRSSWNMLLACLFMSGPWFHSQAPTARPGFCDVSLNFNPHK